MKHRSLDDINALISAILGLIGIGLLTIPNHFLGVFDGLPGWTILLLGVLCFLLGVSCNIMFALQSRPRMELLLRVASVAMLLFLGGMLALGGLIVEGMLLTFIGIAHGLPLTSLWKKSRHDREVLTATAAMSNLACGLLLFSVDRFPREVYDAILPYRIALGSVFLVTAACGAVSFFGGAKRARDMLARSTALPWLLWSGLSLSVSFTAPLIPVLLFAAILLFMDVFPWHSLKLPDSDILGKRVVMVGSTVEFITLLFVSALLALSDRAGVVSGEVISIREAAFILLVLISIIMYYGVATILMTITGLMIELDPQGEEPGGPAADLKQTPWNERLARYLKPFALTRDGLRGRVNAQADQINALLRQVSTEKRRNAQLTLLAELSQQLENQLDQPVAAQLAVNTLERAINCSLVCLYTHDADRHEFMLLAAAGQRINIIPPGFRQDASQGVIGRAIRQRKTQIVTDIRSDPDYILFDHETNLSAIAVPLIFNGHVNGMIQITSEKAGAFGSIDVALAEAVAAELTRAWERSGYHRRLMDLIQAGSMLSSMVEPEATAQEISAIAKQILQARFTYVQIQLGQEGDFLQNASAGNAPRLLNSLTNGNGADPLVRAAFHASQPFRVRDVRKYGSTSHLEIDHSSLRSMLAIPIRWHRLSIGAILAFGKQNEVFFTENDESLAELLSIQAAGAFESAWLQQELRASLRTTSLLYRLSNQIIQEEELKNAALDIAQTAHKLAKGSATGIVLLTQAGEIEAEVQVDANGTHGSFDHPMETIQQAMISGQMIYLSQGHSVTHICLPIQTPIRKYGALWMNIPEDQGHKPTNPADLQTLVNQAAIALERSLLLVESRRQAREIKAAYDTLEATYDQTLAALMSALDARDRETEGHSIRVSHLAGKLGEAMGLAHGDLKALERGSLLHDIGKIGISDTILHKAGPLSEDEWKLMRLHPDIGARIVEGIPFLQETMPVIQCHQERWDGSGYPNGLYGDEIPLVARLFAVVDAFDALTSNRPYRQKVSAEEALAFLQEQAGILFDPQVVRVFEVLVRQGQAAELLSAD
jgi:putative nucleotidyltransferase with HDIG domain